MDQDNNNTGTGLVVPTETATDEAAAETPPAAETTKKEGREDTVAREVDAAIGQAATNVGAAVLGAWSAWTTSEDHKTSAAVEEPAAVETETITAEFGDYKRNVDDAIEQAATSAAAAVFGAWSAFGSKVNKAAEFIDQLEQDAVKKDPLGAIKESLDQYLLQPEETKETTGANESDANGEETKETKKKTYEEWIRLWIEHDDHSSGDIDIAPLESSYYADDSPHRRVWNERCHQDGMDISTNSSNKDREYVFSWKEKEARQKAQAKIKAQAAARAKLEAAAAQSVAAPLEFLDREYAKLAPKSQDKVQEEPEEEVVVTFDHHEEKPLLPDPVDASQPIKMNDDAAANIGNDQPPQDTQEQKEEKGSDGTKLTMQDNSTAAPVESTTGEVLGASTGTEESTTESS